MAIAEAGGCRPGVSLYALHPSCFGKMDGAVVGGDQGGPSVHLPAATFVGLLDLGWAWAGGPFLGDTWRSVS